MKYLPLCFSLLFCCYSCFSQTNVILDADIDSDVDDVAALAILHKLDAKNEINLLGVIVTSDDPFAPLCTDAINTYFKNGHIPIGFKKEQALLKNNSKYTKQVSEEFPHSLKSYKESWDAVALYRKLLSNSADGSVVIVTIGHLTSFQDLLKSEGDSYSPLSGKELTRRKVSKWICMGGMFPSGKEANFYRPDPQSTVFCVQEWTKPVVFCGWEVGKEIISGGKELKSIITVESPVYRSFELYNNFAGRPSWDQVAVLLLTKKSTKYFDTVANGYCHVEEDGSNKWITGNKKNHSYIIIKPKAERKEIAKYINRMTKK